MPREMTGNPPDLSAAQLSGMIGDHAEATGGHGALRPRIMQIGTDDIRAALRQGVRDFTVFRSDVIFAVALYPLMGFVLAFWAFNSGQVHLLFPLIAGFPLVGPVAAVGLYEMSRRHERGEETHWSAALSALRGRMLGPVLTLGFILAVIFVVWLYAAHVIWAFTLGPEPHEGIAAFLGETLTTGAGWTMIILGMGVGLVFGIVALCLGFVSFPMLIDRPVGVGAAVATSLAVARRNPRTSALWGLTVAVLLLLGSIPLFAGLIVVLPVLGHATWHLYRRAVTFPDERSGQPESGPKPFIKKV